MIVGVPPAPRFGHALIALPGTRGEELLLLGGCCVSANAVDGLGHGTRREDLDMKVALAAQRVASAYEIEVSSNMTVVDFYDWLLLNTFPMQCRSPRQKLQRWPCEQMRRLLAMQISNGHGKVW